MSHDRPEGPPRWARWLLERVVPDGASREGLLGDLEELFAGRAEASGRPAAVRWYWKETTGAVARYVADRVRRSIGLGRGKQETRGAGMTDGLVQDLRYAARALRRSPGFTLAAVTTLGLGIGGTTAIFTVVDTVLLRPPIWEAPDRLVNVWTTYPHWRGEEGLDAFWNRIALSYPEYTEWAEAVESMESTAAYTMRNVTYTGGDIAERLTAGVGTASLLDVLGVDPQLGRWFAEGEDADAARLTVLSDRLWTRRFARSPDVIGQDLVLNDERFTIVGVLPPGFALRNVFASSNTGDHDLWMPLGVGANLSARGDRSFDVIARLAGGVAMEAALAESEPILLGDAAPGRRGSRMRARRDVEVGPMRAPLVLLLAASGLLLLIGCLNVATMLLGESLGRREEMATRAALGAGRARIIRQLLTESALLGVGGALVGGAVGTLLVELLGAVGPSLPVARELVMSARIFAFTSGLGVASGLLFGLAPALSLRHEAGASTRRAGRGRRRGERAIQDAVIVAEVGLTVVLLVGGGLLTRTMLNLFSVDPGFETERVAVVSVSATTPSFTEERASESFAHVITNVGSVPGVVAVGGVSTLPLDGASSSTSLEIDGVMTGADSPGPEAQRRVVYPGYHEIMGIPLLTGRPLRETDTGDAPLSMLISERLASIYWPDASPIGARIRYDRRWWTVVGVTGDVRHGALDDLPTATYYVTQAQAPMRSMTFVASTGVEPEALLPRMRDAVRAADADLVVTSTRTMSSLVADAASAQRFRALLVLVFAGMAALLAAIGAFGVTARAVAHQRGELAVRVAMGASTRKLTTQMVFGSTVPVAFGVGVGVAAALLLTRGMASLLFGVGSTDPLTYGTSAAVVLVATVSSSWIAARRVVTLDPVTVLRAE